jgi:hypothetical protein
MAKAINKMLKAELVNYISVHGEMADDALGDMLKKDLVKLAEQLYAKSLQEEPTEIPAEETVLDATTAEYFHMHFQAGFQKKLNDGTQQPQDWGCAVTFRKLDDGKWVCHKSSTRNLAWMTKPKVVYAGKTKPKVVYAGKYEPGVEREVISVTERDIKMLKYWLTSGRYGKTVSQYFSNDEFPNYDACEVGKPMYQSEAVVQVKQGEEIPF